MAGAHHFHAPARYTIHTTLHVLDSVRMHMNPIAPAEGLFEPHVAVSSLPGQVLVPILHNGIRPSEGYPTCSISQSVHEVWISAYARQ